MPAITFTERDMLRGKVVTPGWYTVRIDGVGEKLSKDQQSTNYPVEGTIIKNSDNGSTDFAGVPLDWLFNSKAISLAVGFLASFGVEPKPGQRVLLENAVGKNIDVFVKNDTYEGRLVNRVDHQYRPAKA